VVVTGAGSCPYLVFLAILAVLKGARGSVVG
jgi:hypothetical protein